MATSSSGRTFSSLFATLRGTAPHAGKMRGAHSPGAGRRAKKSLGGGGGGQNWTRQLHSAGIAYSLN